MKNENAVRPPSSDALDRAQLLREYGGPSRGDVCAFCRREIVSGATEREVEAELDGRIVTWRFHPTCAQQWEAGATTVAPER